MRPNSELSWLKQVAHRMSRSGSILNPMRKARAPLPFSLAFRAEAALMRTVERLEGILGAAALSCLTPSELSALTRQLYARGGPGRVDDLHPWESDWFAFGLPSAPSKILVGGAGSGREARHLQSRGHKVFGFDPVLKFLREADLPQQVSLVRGSYEALVNPHGEPEHSFVEWVESHSPYDAVLLGWVSFTHLPDARTRQALLQRLTRLCPDGPILVSFWLQSEGRGAGRPRGRLWDATGRLAARLRRNVISAEPGDLMTHRGFVHLFTESELRQLAARANLSLDPLGARGLYATCPHVTLRPIKGS